MKRSWNVRLERLSRSELERRESWQRSRNSMKEAVDVYGASLQKMKEERFSRDELDVMSAATAWFATAFSPIVETGRERFERAMSYVLVSRGSKEMCNSAAINELTHWVEEGYPNPDQQDRYVRAVKYELLDDVELRIASEVFLRKVPEKDCRYFLSPDRTKLLRRDPQPLIKEGAAG
jgi:hypothetical protein